MLDTELRYGQVIPEESESWRHPHKQIRAFTCFSVKALILLVRLSAYDCSVVLHIAVLQVARQAAQVLVVDLAVSVHAPGGVAGRQATKGRPCGAAIRALHALLAQGSV